jgi:hypothetical protein
MGGQLLSSLRGLHSRENKPERCKTDNIEREIRRTEDDGIDRRDLGTFFEVFVLIRIVEFLKKYTVLIRPFG